VSATPATRQALVVVDVQNDYCAPDGALARRGVVVPTVDAAVDEIERLIDVARQSEVPVIFVRTTHDASTDAGAWKRRTSGDAVCAPGSWGAEFYRLRPAEDAVIVTKHRYSAFVGTDLEQILRAAGIERLAFAGFLTDVCVETSLRDAFVRDYDVTLITDASGTTEERRHAHTIETVARHFGAVRSAAELRALWATSAAALAS
jgi:ureidoacrylate peracid hydrolase